MNDDLVIGGLIEIAKRIMKDCDPRNGVLYDSALFMMHPYCWCESETCEWCEGDAANFVHKPTGLSIWWYKYIGRSMRIENPNKADFVKVLSECCDELAEEIERV